MDPELLQKYVVALAIGGLIGLERERSKLVPKEDQAPESTEFGGIRTFPLIALCGAVTARMSTWLWPPTFALGFAAFAGLVSIAYYRVSVQTSNQGITTAVAALLVFNLGGLCLVGSLEFAAALGMLIYLVLTLKPPLRRLAQKADLEDLYAIGKFGAITLLVLPVLPNEAYGPFGVLNPHKIWLMVVLISAVSFAGYLAVKLLGSGKGFGLTGVLGGLVSSTAVALSFSQKSREYPALSLPSALAIILACTIMVPRVATIVALLHSPLLKSLWPPLAGMVTTGLGFSLLLFHRARKTSVDEHSVNLKNPFELGPAIKFTLIFVVILLGAKLLQAQFGNAGLYISGLAGGLTDVDAIVLSMTKLCTEQSISTEVAAMTITLALLSNTGTKAFLALTMASRQTRKWVVLALLAQGVVGGAMLFIKRGAP